MNGIYIGIVGIGVNSTHLFEITEADHSLELPWTSGIWLHSRLPRLGMVVLVDWYFFWHNERDDAFLL